MKEKEIYFFGEIGWELNARDLAREFENLEEGVKPVLLIHSGGGSVIEGNVIYNLIKKQGNVEAKIIGLCASMATVISSACEKVSISENATYMIHRISGFAFGNPDEMKEELKFTEDLERGLINALAKKSGIVKAMVS